MRLLFIQKYGPRAREIKVSLTSSGHSVHWVAGADSGRQALREGVYDAILAELDWRRSDDEMFPLWFRTEGCHGALLLVVDRPDLADRLLSFGDQVDDFLVKPVELPELRARLLAVERRCVGSRGSLLVHGGLTVDVTAQHATLNGEEIHLPSRELRLLVCLLQNRGRVCDERALKFAMTRGDTKVVSNIVAGYVHTLRRRLPFLPIRTVKGVGYSIDTLGDSEPRTSEGLA